MVADSQTDRAKQVARLGPVDCRATSDWEEVVSSPELDIVIVSTVNKFLAPVTIAALQNGKHVLCEKPMGRNLSEAKQMARAAQAARGILKIGFNHRYHPAIHKAHELCFNGEIGPQFFVRCVYGHGGRPGYEKEWRGDPELAGGGELLDQGIHLIDLCCWFLGQFNDAIGYTTTWFWPIAPLEDNAFALLRTADGRVASLHVSSTRWKNLFVFEVYGRDGFLHVEGLGGSYGLERLTLGRRRPESGPPHETTWEFPGADSSWQEEWCDFTRAIREESRPMGDEEDGLKVMRVVDAIYRSAALGRPAAVES
jgi:predicted dehydrogenase